MRKGLLCQNFRTGFRYTPHLLTLAGSVALQAELGELEAGQHALELSLTKLASGIYLAVAQLDAGLGFKNVAQFKLAVAR